MIPVVGCRLEIQAVWNHNMDGIEYGGGEGTTVRLEWCDTRSQSREGHWI